MCALTEVGVEDAMLRKTDLTYSCVANSDNQMIIQRNLKLQQRNYKGEGQGAIRAHKRESFPSQVSQKKQGVGT